MPTPRIDPGRLALFERIHLASGSHAAPPPDCGDPELCAVETYRWDAAWDAAGDALVPTVAQLQQSAMALVRRMIVVEG